MAPKLSKLPALDFSGQTAVVTGATNGLGLAVSEELLHRHVGTLIMGVRDVTRGEALKARLMADPNIRSTIHVAKLDMEDYKSVVAFSDQVKQLAQMVDILLLNAGLGGLRFEMTKSGHEKMIQVNVLSNTLLALEMLPLLVKTAKARSVPSRLTWVGSFTQTDHSLTKSPIGPDETVLGHFDDAKKFGSISRYPDSKLLTTMLVQELAHHIDSKEVIFNEVSPGPVKTNFGANYPYLLTLVFVILLAGKSRSLSEGANTYLHAVAVAGEESHGQYLSDNKIARRAPIVDTPEGKALQKRLFREVLDDCRKADPRLPEFA